MFTKACEYGIRAMIVIAECSLKKERVSLNNIAFTINSPEAFTSKILQILVKKELLCSVKGVNGGFEIPPDILKTLTLKNVVDSIDGDEKYMSCVLGLKECSDKKPCPVHKKYKYIKADFIKMIEHTTLVEMVNDTKKGNTYLRLINANSDE